MNKIEEYILNGAPVIDVRTPQEFNGANAPGSINIPLNEVTMRLEELRSMPQPLILCCRSGNRSGQAAYYLSQQGIECYNAGSWTDVNYILSKKAS
ncbi:rhodanese-like domain-containing protein [Fulvivirga sedimenti]|uniref:Rhodanese-like domain-containing protein n=1 Tax=Fulvivirga sedimenti TaxID=2879465 RepID=A0A9X1KYG5_9BACT|nr:rhodanese-like domain-containing protein [Fulvivirga sedimenti]MCA6074802.1 rhodanese-like domain-containing protein [Fulvivirga sedimenti]MCA6075979.1 rhodanese-like domain-containing protein [Fulvivirga sedimenti]MCA6077107.1 rhodanese-like domain-containing protein [Fulvivirga sedimenti]